MRTSSSLIISASLALLSASAFAEPKTVTLEIPRRVCSGCVATVTKAFKKVEGVSKAEVSLEKKEAVVTFDDSKTTVDALMKATGDAGFPSSVKAN